MKAARSLAIGIIGFGRIGAEHAGWIGSTDDATRVAGVFDPTPARRELARARGHSPFNTLDALLASDEVDAVLIATPTSLHFEPALAALNAGKHVMLEKPATLDTPTTSRLIDVATERGLVLSVFHCRRWDLDYLTVRQAITRGTFGRVFNVESRLGQWASCVGPAATEFRPQWRNEASYGGGGLYDWGSHFIDQLWQLLLPAKPIRVFAQLRGNVWTRDCDDLARVLIDFDNGAAGLCEINTTTTRPLPRWHIDGSSGSACSPYSLAFDTTQWARLTFTPTAGESRLIEPTSPGLSESQIWAGFAQAVKEGVAPPVTMQSVLTTMRLLDAARESARRGVAVHV